MLQVLPMKDCCWKTLSGINSSNTSFENFKKAMKRYTELDQMTYEQVLTVRYNSMKRKILIDDDFRRGQWEEELAAREETRELKKQERQRKIQDLILMAEKKTGKRSFAGLE